MSMAVVRITVESAESTARKKHAADLGYQLTNEVEDGDEVTLVFTINKESSNDKR